MIVVAAWPSLLLLQAGVEARADSDGLDPRMEPMPCGDPQTLREVGLSTLRGWCFADGQILIYSSANPHDLCLGIVFQIEGSEQHVEA